MHMPEMAPAGHVIEEVGTAAIVDCSDTLVALMPLCCRFTCGWDTCEQAVQTCGCAQSWCTHGSPHQQHAVCNAGADVIRDALNVGY